MGYIPPEKILKAKELDLLTYLKNYDPDELVHIGGNAYTTKSHDSLKISNGKWNWFSRGIGGKTALDLARNHKIREMLKETKKIREMLKEVKNKNSFLYKIKKGFGMGD